MSESGGSRAVLAALLANLGIAASKFVAYFFTGSSSLLPGLHSVADSQSGAADGGPQARTAGGNGAAPFGTGGPATFTRSSCRSCCSASAGVALIEE
jgi:hypothetical protein